MSIAVDLSPADVAFVEEQASAANLSLEVFAYDAIMKAANNAAYLAKLELADRQLREGKVKTFTAEEWEKFVNEQDIY
ncbi:MAG: hypothetical protein IJ849_05245 [Selenomonadaceae bacterium]|nr:hypothetical protein [Selenomonadaceae bacterium]